MEINDCWKGSKRRRNVKVMAREEDMRELKVDGTRKWKKKEWRKKKRKNSGRREKSNNKKN